MNEVPSYPSDARTVFLSYAQQDKATAQLLSMVLRNSGINVWSSEQNTQPGEKWAEAIDKHIKSSDYFVVLLSESSLNSSHIHRELSARSFHKDISDRSITLIPIILDDVKIPDALQNVRYLDFRNDPKKAIDELVSGLGGAIEIDFSKLSPHLFEQLIRDLLSELGFKVEIEAEFNGRKFDFRIPFHRNDPFGSSVTDTWLIEAKHYSSGRLSVSAASAFVSISSAARSENLSFALVTSGQITSPARNILESGHVRLVEGVELKQILLYHPKLVRRYFGRHL